MTKRKLTKKELRERQAFKDRKFNRTLIFSFVSLLIFIILFQVFYVFRHDTEYAYHQYALFGKQVPGELVCMNGDKLLNHKGIKISYNGKIYFFCNQKCFNHFVNHFQDHAFIPDSFSGDTINKADALLGLKKLGEPEIIYFQNIKTFNRYYKSKNK